MSHRPYCLARRLLCYRSGRHSHRSPRFTPSLCLSLSSLALVGCIVQMPKYPSTWSPARNDAECINVTGRFRNIGRSDDNPRSQPMLLTSLLFRDSVGLESASTIELRLVGDSITAIAALPDGSTRISLLGAKGTCTATERRFTAPSNGGAVNRDGVLGITRSFLTLMRTTNRSLVVMQSEGGAGIMLIIPVAGYTRKWSIFEQNDTP
jgi:hypothetical protein